jgi:hypothetical protein
MEEDWVEEATEEVVEPVEFALTRHLEITDPDN